MCNVCADAGLEFVNSEEEQWIHTRLHHSDNFQKPDGCSAIPNLYISGNVHREEALHDLRVLHPAEYKFGKGIWSIRDMYKVWEYKVKIYPADRGKAYSYALHLSREDPHNLYIVILCDALNLYIISARNGAIVTVQKTTWSTAGSRDWLIRTLQVKSKWHELLDKCCEELQVCVVRFLGAGSCGRCFEVADASDTRYILKTVLTIHSRDSLLERGTVFEYQSLAYRLTEVPHVVRVKGDSLKFITSGGSSLGVAYLMTQVGTPLVEEMCKQQPLFRQLLSALIEIHKCGFCHGDARVANAVILDDSVVWVDFMITGINASTLNRYLHQDVEMLVKSVFGSAMVNSDAFKQIVYESSDMYINAVLEESWT
jgi:hypothetical protein